jgi:hypothetical protein
MLDLEFRSPAGATLWRTDEYPPAIGMGLVVGDTVAIPEKDPLAVATGPPWTVVKRWVKFLADGKVWVVITLG